MAKRCPSCGYGPIGPFIDNCPICAEPVRNVRSSGRGGGGIGHPSGWPVVVRWVVGGALVAVLLVGGCCGLGMWRLGNAVQDMQKDMIQAQAEAQAQMEADRKARTVVVAAADLLKEMHDDPTAADQKYLGKYLELTGVVERTGNGRDGPFVILHGGDDAAKVKVECFFETANKAELIRIQRLPKGETVTVRGEYDGRVSNVQLRECVLVK